MVEVKGTDYDVATAAVRVRRAQRYLSSTSSDLRRHALRSVADAIRQSAPAILQANQRDVGRGAADLVDRLRLDEARVESMARAVEEVSRQEDPLGRRERSIIRPNGLEVSRLRMPLGVIGIIYEARPNVTSDAAALCLMSGNGVLLKGGSDAIDSNRAVYAAIQDGLERVDRRLVDAVGFVDSTDRGIVEAMLKLSNDIDLIIPRGGKGLIRFVHEHSRIPVIKHDEGVCHVVIDGDAAAAMVDEIVLNAKVQRPSVCNAMETLLVLESAVQPHLIRVLRGLEEAGVLLYLCERSYGLARQAGLKRVEQATDESFAAEFLDLRLAVRVVSDLDAALDHIAEFGSNHTEAIVTNDRALAREFVRKVQSSCVMVNASTRFADGGELGLGAEIGISTTRLHAYGPMGLEELTTTRFVVEGEGQVRS